MSEKCKRCPFGETAGVHHGIDFASISAHSFEPEDAAPALTEQFHLHGTDDQRYTYGLQDEAGARVAGDRCHNCGKPVVWAADSWVHCSATDFQRCGKQGIPSRLLNKPCEPVAQPGAGGEQCAVCGCDKSQHRPYARPRADKPLGLEPTGWICPEPPFSSAIRCFKPAEPAAGQGAEPPLDLVIKAYHYRQPDAEWSDKEVAAFAEMHAAHVTKGLEARLAQVHQMYRVAAKDWGLAAQARDAAEARNLELMGELERAQAKLERLGAV